MTMGMFFWVKKVVPFLIVAADGSGDYTDIQSAIDALPTTGGQIFVKAGTYTLTAFILLNKNNVSIIGTGRTTIITSNSALSYLLEIDNSNYLIKGIYFDGNSKTVSEGIITASATGIIEDCFFTAFDTNGIDLSVDSVRTIVRGNEIFSNGGIGIYAVFGLKDSLITNNFIYSNESFGLKIASSTNTSNNRITNNLVYSNGSHGIEIKGNYNVVSNNNIYSNSGDGIKLKSNADYCVITDNTCSSNTGYGINVASSTCNSNVLVNNTLLLNTSGAINDNGTDTRMAHNVE